MHARVGGAGRVAHTFPPHVHIVVVVAPWDVRGGVFVPNGKGQCTCRRCSIIFAGVFSVSIRRTRTMQAVALPALIETEMRGLIVIAQTFHSARLDFGVSRTRSVLSIRICLARISFWVTIPVCFIDELVRVRFASVFPHEIVARP